MAKKKRKSKGSMLVFPILMIIIIGGLYLLEHMGMFDRLLKPNICSSTAEGELDVHFIDVGQGDCSLIVSGDNAILIDTGEKDYAERVCRYLQDYNVPDIDLFLVTHPHSDHMGGASYMIDNCDVKKIVTPRIPDDLVPTSKAYEKFLKSAKKKGLKLTEAKPGDEYDAGDGATLKIISPVRDDYTELNDFTAAAILTHGKDKVLFAGDLEKKSERDIADEGYLEDVSVLKVAHHGSSGSSCKEFLSKVKPEAAVIMCDGKSYGHPSKKALDRISKYTKNIYRTDLNGTIILRSMPDKLEIETEK